MKKFGQKSLFVEEIPEIFKKFQKIFQLSIIMQKIRKKKLPEKDAKLTDRQTDKQTQNTVTIIGTSLGSWGPKRLCTLHYCSCCGLAVHIVDVSFSLA